MSTFKTNPIGEPSIWIHAQRVGYVQKKDTIRCTTRLAQIRKPTPNLWAITHVQSTNSKLYSDDGVLQRELGSTRRRPRRIPLLVSIDRQHASSSNKSKGMHGLWKQSIY